MERSARTIETPSTIQKALMRATEYGFCIPQVEEEHQKKIELLRGLGVIGGQHGVTNYGFKGRMETALHPPLEWSVGRSTLRVYVVLVTEVVNPSVPRSVQHSAPGRAKNVDPLTRTIERAFCDAGYGMQSYCSESLNGTYATTSDGQARFLRIYISEPRKFEILDTEEERLIYSYLKFYRDGFPKPHSSSDNAVPL